MRRIESLARTRTTESPAPGDTAIQPKRDITQLNGLSNIESTDGQLHQLRRPALFCDS